MTVGTESHRCLSASAFATAGTTWFNLWSALCHQGDAYTASYAAVPHLVRMASAFLQRQQYDPLFLTACIELARHENSGTALSTELVSSYRETIDDSEWITHTHYGIAELLTT